MLNIYVADQEQGLEALSKVISRQKEIAETIGSEVDLQNGKLLLQMGDPVLHCQPSSPLSALSLLLWALTLGNRMTNSE